MKSVKPAYFYGLGFTLNSVTHLRDDVPGDIRHSITVSAWQALTAFVVENSNKEILPQSYAKAESLVDELGRWATATYSGRIYPNYEQLRRAVEGLSVTLTDELDSIFCYVVSDKGNLSVARLVAGASKRYGAETLALLDKNITNEIDAAGRCLAFTMYTACGFHILRSVEIAIKAYVHAATGSLPAINKRNWGEYIAVLTSASADPKLVDLLRILKTKRNPLMHPQESLDEDEAVDILCLCQSVTGELVKDVKKRTLGATFSASLALLSTI